MPENRIEPLFKYIGEIGVIHPGDTLIVSAPDGLTNEQAEYIKTRVEDELPGIKVVVIGAKVTVARDA